MYVRWRRHKRAEKRGEDRWLLAASLVESQRVGGKPRQRTICYLGSIREDRLSEVGPRRWFWESAEARFDRASIPNYDWPQIAAVLEARVPRPSIEEMADAAETAAKQLTEAAVMLKGFGRPDLLLRDARVWQEDADRLRQSAEG